MMGESVGGLWKFTIRFRDKRRQKEKSDLTTRPTRGRTRDNLRWGGLGWKLLACALGADTRSLPRTLAKRCDESVRHSA